MLDTGASCSIIDLGTIQNLGLDKNIIKSTHELIDASGNDMSIAGSVDLNVHSRDFRVVQNMKVLNSKTFRNVILGRDFLSHFKTVEFDFVGNRVKLGNQWSNCVEIRGKELVRLNEKTSVAGRTETVIQVKCKKSTALITADFEPIPISEKPGIYATYCRVIPNIEGVFNITLLNVTDQSIELDCDQMIGHLVSTDKSVSVIEPVSAATSPTKDNIVVGSNLSMTEKEQISSLICKYKDVFASNPKKPNLVKNMKHRIITNNEQPVNRKPYRVPYAWHAEVDKQIQEMVDNNIIRPSSSPWNAPIILVRKKDNSMRFVCDFRGLNDVTKKDSYPLPRIRDVIDNMQGTEYWTTLDAASAYWSIPVAETDKEKTAFSVSRGKFEFNVMPFGLCNAGASYQRMMDINLAGLPTNRILAYMDDIVVFSKTFDEHLSSIEQLFQRLQTSGISLKLSKCVFASNKVDFLGFELSNVGIKPQSRLTDAINKYGVPSTKKELKGFLGLAGFYRDFIPDFAKISKPLNELTSDKTQFNWTPSCDQAFNKLKHLLSSEPVLHFPDLSKQFVLEVDASNYAVGGVLSQQGNDNKLHPVAYFSTALQKSQQNWSATSKEAFALVLAVRHWHVYLTGRHFVLNSDHNPLTHLRQQRDPRGKFGRWISELEEFDYSISYIRGKDNTKADALSRNHAANQSQPASEFENKIYASFLQNDSFLSQLKAAQLEDPLIKSNSALIASQQRVTQGRLKRIQSQLRIENGLLTKSGRPIIPASLRRFVVNEYHKSAHLGVDKMYSLLRDRFYWPNMYGYIRSFVTACETCQRTKSDSLPPKAPLVKTYIPNAPMQFVSLDIAYLPKDSHGYQYILLIGDVFSKYIEVIPLKDQTAQTVVDAFVKNWIYIHGTPFFLLTDQGSNVDGTVMRDICNLLGIEKRRSSAYHSPGNGFAERNIRSIKDMLRSVLLHRRLDQSKWRSVLPELVFALNTSFSKSTKCVPYSTVFGRSAVLPQDIVFQEVPVDEHERLSASDYEEEVTSILSDVYKQVVEALELNKQKMQQYYNKNLRFYNYSEGQQVWLKTKHYKSGENRKLAPRRTGPWTVLKKLPNGVNFQIKNTRNETKVVHHDRLSPVTTNEFPLEEIGRPSHHSNSNDESSSCSDQFSSDDSASSDSDSSYSDSAEDSDVEVNPNPDRNRTYPTRIRRARQIPGGIPWTALT